MFAASLPVSGSVRAKAAMASPDATLGSHSAFCASLPNRRMAPEPSPCMAKAKSARPLWYAKVERAIARLRTSPSVQSFSSSAAPSSQTKDRHSSSTLPPWWKSRSSHHWPRRSASARCLDSKKGQPSQSVTLELRRLLGGERLIGPMEIPGLHALRLSFGFQVERLLYGHRPFLIELTLGHEMRQDRAVGQQAGEGLRLGVHVLDDAAEEAPALPFLGAHAATGEQKLGSSAVADDPGEDGAGAHVGTRQADAGEKEAGLGMGCGEPQVAGHRHDRPGTGAHAVDRRNDRLRTGAH